MNIRIGIVEDHASVREALASLIKSTPGYEIVRTWPDAESCLKEAPTVTMDVLLMDINLPGRSGIECVRELKQNQSKLQVIMLTIEEDSDRVFESLRYGAAGYLVKSSTPTRILEAIKEVHQGGSPMSGHIARMVVQSMHKIGRSSQAAENLTSREDDILKLICRGFRAKEIGEQLGISVYTVQTHIRNIYDKLHVRNRAEVVALYLK